MQGIFLDPKGRKMVLAAHDLPALAAVFERKRAQGWALAPESPQLPARPGTETSGVFLDPQGREMPLSATSARAFRELVTRKKAQGWKDCAGSPRVEPLTNEYQVALGPTWGETLKAEGLSEPEPMPPMPSAEERNEALASAKKGK